MRVNEKNIVLQNRFKSHEAILLANILKNQLFERTLQLILHALKQTNENGNKFKKKKQRETVIIGNVMIIMDNKITKKKMKK